MSDSDMDESMGGRRKRELQCSYDSGEVVPSPRADSGRSRIALVGWPWLRVALKPVLRQTQ